MDPEHGNESSKLPRITEADTRNLDDSSEPSSTEVDFDHSGGTRTSSETTRSEVTASMTDVSMLSNSLPSSLSKNSSDGFFQVDPKKTIPVSKLSDDHDPPKPEERASSPHKEGKADVLSTGPLYQLEEMYGSSCSTSQNSDITYESAMPILSPRQSPPVQVMERSRGVYDPDRIPASVFGKPNSPLDWSTASGESLFSIQIGNASFSRDHGYKLAGDTNQNDIGKSGELYAPEEFYKSGELDALSDYYTSRELQESSDIFRWRQSSPVAKGGRKARDFDLPNRTIRHEGRINPEANIQSFDNPMRKKSSKLSCTGCSNCSCKCPSCSICCFGCPSCSSCSCKWPDCCSCECPSSSICCSRSLSCCSCKSLSFPSCSWKWSCFASCWNWLSCSGCFGNCKSGCCKSLSWPSCSCKCGNWLSCCSKESSSTSSSISCNSWQCTRKPAVRN